MVRPLRIEYADAVYHVMNRGLARHRIFVDKDDCRDFLMLVDDAYRRWKIRLYAYALMGNHYHMCIQTPGGNIARVMRHIDGVYTQRFNRRHKRDGPLFRGRYKAIVIDEENYLGEVVRYIHLNPVKAGMVKSPGTYKWSSHGCYMNAQIRPKWLNAGKLLESLGGAKGFEAFVMEGNTEEIEKFYGGKKQDRRWGVNHLPRRLESGGISLRRSMQEKSCGYFDLG